MGNRGRVTALLILASAFSCGTSLQAQAGIAIGAISTIKTANGRTVDGEIQGVVVAKAGDVRSEMIFVVAKGADIRMIDERGVTATRLARQTVSAVPGITFPPDARIAEDMATSAQQIWYESPPPVPALVLGELELGKDGADSRIVPRLRLKTEKGELTIAVAELVKPSVK